MASAPSRSDAFAKRLERIEARGEARAAAAMPLEEPVPEIAMSEPVSEPMSEPLTHEAMPLVSESGAVRVGPVRIGLILLTLLAMFGMGAMAILNYAEGIEPEPIVPVVVRR